MKFALIVAGALALATPVLAQHAGHHKAPPATAGTIKGTGVVKGVNAKAGTIKIQHGPIAALKWPAMTMDFKAAPAVIAAARTGKTVTFTLDPAGKEVLALQ
jgi:Cu(I)/Ag(I) efflux system protein CusF